MRKFFDLPAGDRRLLVTAALWVAGIRVLLWFLPFSRLKNFLTPSRKSAGQLRSRHPERTARVAWAIGAAARYIPQATCLTQALAAQALLRREGIPAKLCLGASKDRDGKFLAHAWLEQDGQVILGEHRGEFYTAFGNVAEQLTWGRIT